MSNKELITTLKAKREALRTFRFSVAGGKVKNVKEGRALRRDIARTLTALAKPVAQIEKPAAKAK